MKLFKSNSSRIYTLTTALTVWVNIMSDVDWEGTNVGDSLNIVLAVEEAAVGPVWPGTRSF